MDKRFDKTAFLDFAVAEGVVAYHDSPLTLKSGQQSHYYVNWRPVTSDAFLLDRLSGFVLDFASDLDLSIDTFYGVPEGATKLGVISQYKYAQGSKAFEKGAYALAMGRRQPKEHGSVSDRYFIGAPKGRTVVLEDVTTTGGSLIDCIRMLQDSEIDVVAAIGLTNRDEGRSDGRSVEEAVSALSVPYYAMSRLEELQDRIV